MRVLYLIDSLGGGGAESLVTNLINYLIQNEPQIECDVVTLYPEKYLSEKKFPIHCLALDSKYSLKGIGLVRHMLARSYDVVHVHLFPANYYAALASPGLSNLAWVYTEHSIWNRRRRFPPLRFVETAIYSRFDRIIAVSSLVATSLIRWLPSIRSRVCVIPNGVPVPKLDNDHRYMTLSGYYTILFVGRLEYVKGVDVLLEAFACLPDNCKLLIAGDGSQRKALETLAGRLQVHDRVEFLGFRTDVQRLMTSVDCVVLPSRWEGLPMVLLEAMAVGAPVVASAVGGIPEIVEHEVTGWLVPPEDPMRLAYALKGVLKDRAKSHYVGEKARKRIIESYSVETVAKRTISLYWEVLHDKSRPHHHH